jgi:hypothetical protein
MSDCLKCSQARNSKYPKSHFFHRASFKNIGFRRKSFHYQYAILMFIWTIDDDKTILGSLIFKWYLYWRFYLHLGIILSKLYVFPSYVYKIS